MFITEGMQARTAVVRLLVIVTEHAVEAWQNANRIHRQLASLRMGRQLSQTVIRRAMQPVTFIADVEACFIGALAKRSLTHGSNPGPC